MDEAQIESKAEYGDDPRGLQTRWGIEIEAAKKNQEEFWTDGDRVIKEYLGEGGGVRLNLYHADVQTKSASLSGMPKVRAVRRHADAKDDVARVSADMIQRLLNTDVEQETDGFRRALKEAQGDWMKPGLGQLRMRYVVQEHPPCEACQGQPMEPVCPECEGKAGTKAHEDVETDHVHWRDYLWSPCRTWNECRWTAYGADLSKEALHERFDGVLEPRLVDMIPLNSRDPQKDEDVKDVWARARIWEIWDKESKSVLWFAEGFDRILDQKPDPLGLPGFFPSPQPLVCNVTSSKFIPRAWYFLVQDLYEEAHNLTQRIRELVKAIKVVGAYSRGNEALAQILDEACENQMVAVDDLSTLTGSAVGQSMWFMPIEPQVRAVMELIQQRNLVRSDIAEVLGLSDIMRGQQAVRATATTDRIKARAFSMRAQKEQDDFAQFASDAQRIRAHIISKHFDPVTIIRRSNIEQAADPQLILPAVQMLKDDIAQYRIDVDSDSLAMTDLDAMQQESMGSLKAITEYMAGWAPLIQGGGPQVAKMSMELLKVAVATFRGADRYEGIIDRALADIEEAEKAKAMHPPMPPPPNPKVEAEKAKAQSTMVKAQTDQAKAVMDLQVTKAKTGMEMQKMAGEVAVTRAKSQAAMVEAVTRPPPMPGEVEEPEEMED